MRLALPLPYDPSVETPAPGEEETRAKLDASMRSIQETTLRD